MLDIVFLIIFTDSSLFFFKSIFLISSKFHVSILKSALVWSISCISGWDHFLQEVWKIVQLYHEMTHSIHVFPLFWIRILCPNLFSLSSFNINDCSTFTPFSVNFINNIFFILENLSINFIIRTSTPTSFMKFKLTPFTRLRNIFNS